MLVVVTLAITLLVLFLGYCHHRQQYWQSKGVFVPPVVPLLGHANHLFSRTRNMYEIWREYMLKSHAPYMGWYEGLTPALVVHDLAVLKNILVKDFDHFIDRRPFDLSNPDELVFKEMLFVLTGEKWKGLRSIISPTFTSGKLKGIFPLIEAKCKKLVKWCLEVGTTRDKVEMYFAFNRFTLDGIASSVFGLETNCIDNEKDEFAIAAEKVSRTPGIAALLKFAVLTISPRLFSLLRLRVADPALDFFTKSAKRTLEMRKNSEWRGDFIDLMLEAKREHDLDTAKNKYPLSERGFIGPFFFEEHGQNVTSTKERYIRVFEDFSKELESLYPSLLSDFWFQQDGTDFERVPSNHDLRLPDFFLWSYHKDSASVTDDTIISQEVLFLFAGFQTTSAALSLATGLLARHPEEQERLREELRSLVETRGKLDYQAIGEAKYLDACIHEALRLYPPGPFSERMTTKDYTIPGTGVKIEKGTVIVVNVWGLNRDPRIWEDPDDFKPERFLPENKTPDQTFAFQSFGQGPRNCIGMRFALLECKLVLAHLVLNMELRPAPGFEGPIELEVFPNVIKVKGGMNLVFEPLEA